MAGAIYICLRVFPKFISLPPFVLIIGQTAETKLAGGTSLLTLIWPNLAALRNTSVGRALASARVRVPFDASGGDCLSSSCLAFFGWLEALVPPICRPQERHGPTCYQLWKCRPGHKWKYARPYRPVTF